MKTLKRSSCLLLLLLLTVHLFSQATLESATISGRIIIDKDSIYPLKPYSIIVQKNWPITFKEFEQQIIDTTDFSFNIRMDLDQLTYGNIIVNFFQDIDSTALAKRGSWISSDKHVDFYEREYSRRIIFSGVRFVLEPGDSLNMIINYDNVDSMGRASVHFSGHGGANNNQLRSKDHMWNASKNFRLPLYEGLSNEDLVMEDELKNLNEAKDSISPAYFSLLKTDILFDNLSMKHALIRASLYGPEVPIEEKRTRAREYYSFLDTLTLRPEYLSSLEFRGFLSFYLEYVNRIISGEDIAYSYDEKNYYLARAVFEKDVLRTFLYERLRFQMDELKFYPDKTYQFEEFLSQFPHTPESYRLTQIHSKRYPVSKGQPAPDLELIDASGKTTHLSKLKGKVVIISPYLRDRQKQIEVLQNKLAGNKLVVVSLSRLYSRPGDKVSPYVDYYVKDDVQNQNQYSYQFRTQHSYAFIVNKNGMLEDCVYNLNLSIETIAKLRLERYTFLTRMNNYVQNHAPEIIVFLSLLLSISLVFFLVTRLKQKRQELIRKHLNSELKAIRSQLNPHFLFNSLNSLQNFINQSDKPTANMHLSKFSHLMRRVIEMSEEASTSLKEELDFNKTFIELEQLRYGFKCKFDIDEAVDLYNTEIPSMIIQPFIENAIVHCMAELGAQGELGISIREADSDSVMVEISDNGKGFQLGKNKGFGLKSSRERIDLLNFQNKDKIKLQIESSTLGSTKQGSTVRLIIPKKY